MTKQTQTPAPAVSTGDPRVRAAFGTLRTSFLTYAAISAAGLAIVITVAATGHTVNTFMWVRGVLLPLIAILLYRMTLTAGRGVYKSFDRVRALTLIMPIAIIGIDLIPGVCPVWYLIMQVVCMLPVIVAAVVIRRPALREAFPKPS